MDRPDLTCPVCGRPAFDSPPPQRDAERTCQHCGSLLLLSHDDSDQGEGIILTPLDEQSGPAGGMERILGPEQLRAAKDWWSRSELLLALAWRAMRSSPSVIWPLMGAFFAAVAGLYVADGIAHPIGLLGVLLGPGLGLWLLTMSASALALALFRTGKGQWKQISFGRAFRMLLEHKKGLSHRIAAWILLGTLGAAAAVLLVSLITAAALFLPGTKLMLGILLGVEILAAAALLPVGLLTGAGLALQPIRACTGGKTALKDDLGWWRLQRPEKTWMATGVFLSVLAGALGLSVGLASLDAVLGIDSLVIPTDMREVLSASVLAPLLGIDRAVDPALSLQLAGAAASAGICAALAVLVTPALALWSACSAAAATLSGHESEVHPTD